MSSATPTTPSQFKYVFIPADTIYPIEVREFDQVSLEDDQFIKMVKKYFAISNPESGVDRDMLIKQMSQHAKKDITSAMDPETLENMLTSTSVDILSISVPSKENDFFGVSLYCDDKGKAKRLPLNERATGLGSACGLIGQTFHGHIFLSRMYDDQEENWFRVDFTMEDVSSNAPWVKRCAEQASRKIGGGPASLSGLAERFLANSGQSPALITSDDYRDNKAGNIKGETDKYRWYQTGEEIELTFPVDPSVTKAQIAVEIKPKSLKVKVGNETVSEGDLFDRIDTSESTWTFSQKDHILQVSLCKKTTGKMWDIVFRQ